MCRVNVGEKMTCPQPTMSFYLYSFSYTETTSWHTKTADIKVKLLDIIEDDFTFTSSTPTLKDETTLAALLLESLGL